MGVGGWAWWGGRGGVRVGFGGGVGWGRGGCVCGGGVGVGGVGWVCVWRGCGVWVEGCDLGWRGVIWGGGV